MFKAEIMHMIDLDNSKLNHKSISGGRATHSFNHIMTLTDSTLEGLKSKIIAQFGQPYDIYENKMYLSIDQSDWSEVECPENYEAIVYEVDQKEVTL